jgi:biotin carboxyl carrier protein
MKLQAEIDGETIEVDIKLEGDRLLAVVGDREYSLEISEPEDGVLLFKKGSQIFEVFVTQPNSPDSPTHVAIRGSEYDVSIIDPKRLRGTRSDHAHAGGAVEIKTAMPGKVVRLLAGVGDEVNKGDGVVVVEAMKMQNEIKAPKAGLVREVRVAENDTVNAGQTLVVIE